MSCSRAHGGDPGSARGRVAGGGPEAALPEFALSAAVPLGAACLAAGLGTYRAAAAHVRALPYARPCARDLGAVLREGRGTCSAKHAFVAALAHEHGRTDVRLVVGLYFMCEANTPGVGATLAAFGFEAVPEAHCYLRLGAPGGAPEATVDLTGLPPGDESPLEGLVEEHEVAPRALASWKARYHRRAVARWAQAWGFDADVAWAAREACVAVLAERAAARGGTGAPFGSSLGGSLGGSQGGP